MSALVHGTVPSPLGPVHVVTRGDVCVGLGFDDGWERVARTLARRFGPAAPPEPGGPVPGAVADALGAYFGGDVDALEPVAADPGGTPFQARVWARLRTIRPGTTATYGEVARAIGAPTAVRAVGAANGGNPVSLVVPCHRVVGAAGLVGYAGGIDRKRWLLAHEAPGLFDRQAVSADGR